MDHIPQKSPVAEFRVSYFEGPQWNREICDLADWPQYIGWDINLLLLHGDLQGKTVDELLHLLQSWLYLGFIRCFAQTEIDESMFVTEELPAGEQGIERQKRYITSASLPDVVKATEEYIKWATPEEQRTWIEELQPPCITA